MIAKLKYFLRDYLGLPPWAILAVAGCLLYILVNALLRKPVTSAWGLLGPLAAGIALESYEIWVQYRQSGLFAPDNEPIIVIFARHGLDVIVMLVAPILIVLFGAVTAR